MNEEKKKFLEEWEVGEFTIAELCRRHGISRPTGYNLIGRYEIEGDRCLEARSRAPIQHPHAMPIATVERILELRTRRPNWGPRKLRAVLAREMPDLKIPAASSIGDLLKREGLVQSRRRRKTTAPYGEPLGHASESNRVWCTDFKGWFVCGDGRRCDPLTITDAYSRYLLRCRAVAKTDGSHVRAVFESVFREFGLPDRIRTDNGAPFASKAPAGLSRLSMWWTRLGIQHERIEQGHPEQNGRHERMHRTLKAEVASPPKATYACQQRAFADFEEIYNHERPHEALGQVTPGSIYAPSQRQYPTRPPEPKYPGDCLMRKIRNKGDFYWKGNAIFVSEVLTGEHIGLLQSEQDGTHEIYYGPILLGRFDERKNRFLPRR